MARVTFPEIPPDPDDPEGSPGRPAGEPFEVADNDEVLLAYYQGEGAIVERGVHVVARGPMEFDGEQYLEVQPVVELPGGEVVTESDALPAKSATRAEWEQAARDLGVSDEAIDGASTKADVVELAESAAAALPAPPEQPEQP